MVSFLKSEQNVKNKARQNLLKYNLKNFAKMS